MHLKSQNKIDPKFNMSSMTDIVFLLLVFFIIIAQFMSPNALGLTLPNSNSQNRVNPSDITITIKQQEEGVLYVYENSETTSLYDLSDYLKQNSDSLTKPLVLQAESKVQIQEIISIVDEAVKYNYEVVFATKSK
tara:strand:- start:564 stop:968 length:405 start_codon:yes stop_codon:yes gene_type:complete